MENPVGEPQADDQIYNSIIFWNELGKTFPDGVKGRGVAEAYLYSVSIHCLQAILLKYEK